jgi:hypothetical protein
LPPCDYSDIRRCILAKVEIVILLGEQEWPEYRKVQDTKNIVFRGRLNKAYIFHISLRLQGACITYRIVNWNKNTVKVTFF